MIFRYPRPIVTHDEIELVLEGPFEFSEDKVTLRKGQPVVIGFRTNSVNDLKLVLRTLHEENPYEGKLVLNLKPQDLREELSKIKKEILKRAREKGLTS